MSKNVHQDILQVNLIKNALHVVMIIANNAKTANLNVNNVRPIVFCSTLKIVLNNVLKSFSRTINQINVINVWIKIVWNALMEQKNRNA